MSADWKDQLKHVYKNLQQDKKTKKDFKVNSIGLLGIRRKKDLMIPEFPSPPKQPKVYAGIKPLIEADILALLCSKLTRKEQQLRKKDGSI